MKALSPCSMRLFLEIRKPSSGSATDRLSHQAMSQVEFSSATPTPPHMKQPILRILVLIGTCLYRRV